MKFFIFNKIWLSSPWCPTGYVNVRHLTLLVNCQFCHYSPAFQPVHQAARALRHAQRGREEHGRKANPQSFDWFNPILLGGQFRLKSALVQLTTCSINTHSLCHPPSTSLNTCVQGPLLYHSVKNIKKGLAAGCCSVRLSTILLSGPWTTFLASPVATNGLSAIQVPK